MGKYMQHCDTVEGRRTQAIDLLYTREFHRIIRARNKYSPGTLKINFCEAIVESSELQRPIEKLNRVGLMRFFIANGYSDVVDNWPEMFPVQVDRADQEG